jgi:uncharacterized damage-inducible protein DinB
MMSREIEHLVKHMEWADAATWNAVLQAPGAAGDAGLLERLHHLHTVQSVYLQIWRGDAIAVTDVGIFPDLPALADWAKSCHARLRVFVQGLDGALLSRPIEPWSAEIVKRFGSVPPVTVVDTVLQVVLHSTYHRGQVATRIRELGGAPPLTDFIAWVWQNRPEPAWPASALQSPPG